MPAAPALCRSWRSTRFTSLDADANTQGEMLMRLMNPLASLTLLAAALIVFPDARAETSAGSNADTRVVLTFKVRPEAVQQWLSGPWRVDSFQTGPAKGANVSLVFVDQHLVVDADGKPMGSGVNRTLALVVPAKHSGTGAFAPVPEC